MAINLSTAYTRILDQVFKTGALTGNWAPAEGLVQGFEEKFGSATVKVANLTMDGFGDYDRASGYPTGGVDLKWESHTITNDRAIEHVVDHVDNIESLQLSVANLAGEFSRIHAQPEVDAIRFAAAADKAGETEETTITDSNVLNEMQRGEEAFLDNSVPMVQSVWYITPFVRRMLQAAGGITLNRDVDNSNLNGWTGLESLNGFPIVVVPQSRFYDAITLNDGATTYGYAKGGSAVDLNMMLVHLPAVNGIMRHASTRVFSPNAALAGQVEGVEGVNPDMEAWKFQTRMYHDLIVPANKVNGIYVNKKTA